MTIGKVEAIFIAPARGKPTISIDQAHVVPGKGIEGDRYFGWSGTPEKPAKPGREITFIEMEAIESLRQAGVQITPEQTRRNIVTNGIPLNDLVDRSFLVGDIKFRGVRLCEPCSYLANRTDPRILQLMVNRGGLRAEIITEGIIRQNDIITITE